MIEQLLREAYEDAARTVRPEQIRPLSAGRGRRARLIALTPLAAAAAVTAVIAAVVAIPHLVRGTGPAVATPVSPPPYMVTAIGPSPGRLVVRRAGTQDVTGSVRPPAGMVWTYVAATADPATFIAAAGEQCGERMYRLTLTASGMPAGLAPLPVPAISGQLLGLAASADGRTIAYSALPVCTNVSHRPPRTIGLLYPGGTRTWTVPDNMLVSNLSLSADGSELAFSSLPVSNCLCPQPTTPRAAEWVLTARATPGDVFAHARQLVTTADPGFAPIAVLSPDGATLYAVVPVTKSAAALAVYRVADGRLLRTLHRWQDPGSLTYANPGLALAGDQLLIWGIIKPGSFRVDLDSGRVTFEGNLVLHGDVAW